MKIYFDGDSWTWGGELEKELRESQRFSRLVCEKIGAEENNLSRSGASNERIVRHLFVENDIAKYDLAIIQMTYPSRTEYFHQEWRTVSIQHTKLWKPWKPKRKKPSYVDPSKGMQREHEDFWTYYYDKIYCEYYGSIKERIIYQIIKDHCKVNNVPLILMTNNNWDTDLKFDIELEHTRYSKAPNGHPNEEGHKQIADRILSMLP